MYERLYTIDMPIQRSIGDSFNATLLFGVRGDEHKATVYIVEVDTQKVTHTHDVVQQMPLLERKCFERISQAKKLH